jgi:tetratricopeptide (TPR) repeat protein
MTSHLPAFRRNLNEWTNRGITALPGLILALTPALPAAGQEATTITTARITESEKLVESLVAESQIHKKERKGDPKEPLRQAEEFTKALGSDVSELGRHQRLVVAGYCAQGRFEEALERAEEAFGGSQYIARSIIADAAARAGKFDLAREQVKIALEHVNLCANGLQKDELRRHAALALLELGDTEQALALEQVLPPVDVAELLLRRPLTGNEGAKAPRVEEIKKLTEETKASARVHALLTLAWAERQFASGNKEAGRTLLNHAGEAATATLDAAAHLVLVDIARTAKKHGMTEEADKSLNILVTNGRSYADAAEWKAGALVRAAMVCHEWGREKEAKELIALAEISAPKVFAIFAPQAWLEVARGHLVVGNAEAADKAVVNALRAGMAHSHPRVWAMAAVQSCLFLAEMKQPISEPVAQLLEQIRVGPSSQG